MRLPKHSFSPREIRQIESALRAVAAEIPSMPGQFTNDQADPKGSVIRRDRLNEDTFGFVVFGPKGEEKSQAIDRIRSELDRRGVDAHILVAGTPIGITPAQSHKGNAVRQFSERAQVPLDQMLKFGDQSGPHGVDRPLLCGRNAYNVGLAPAFEPNVINCSTSGPAGVAKVLRQKREAGIPVPAVATDLDGTINDKHSENGRYAHPEVARELVEVVRRGGKVAIITARGPKALEFVLGPMKEAGLKASQLSSVTFYLFNGGKGVQPTEWPELVG